MRFGSRTALILESAVREFIKTGQPVSSAFLYNRYDLGIKPASIRMELNFLTEKGFLDQPHTSAGRVPTDRGYKFFADRLLIDKANRTNRINKSHKTYIDLVDDIVDELGVLGVGYEPTEDRIYKAGLDELFSGLDVFNKSDIYEIVNDFEMLDDRMDRIFNYISGTATSVFIGKSPVTKSRLLSVVARMTGNDAGSRVLIAIGPKRMNYEKVIKMFESLRL
jgi:transcriptional regulator of heat shock response